MFIRKHICVCIYVLVSLIDNLLVSFFKCIYYLLNYFKGMATVILFIYLQIYLFQKIIYKYINTQTLTHTYTYIHHQNLFCRCVLSVCACHLNKAKMPFQFIECNFNKLHFMMVWMMRKIKNKIKRVISPYLVIDLCLVMASDNILASWASNSNDLNHIWRPRVHAHQLFNRPSIVIDPTNMWIMFACRGVGQKRTSCEIWRLNKSPTQPAVSR